MKKLLLITGWAHGPSAFQPLAERLRPEYSVNTLSATEVLAQRTIPDADWIAGWSMGGMLAMDCLPSCCKKLILIASTANFCTSAKYDKTVSGDAAHRIGALMRHKPNTALALLQRNPEAVLPDIARNMYYPQQPPPFPPSDTPELSVLTDALAYLLKTDLREKVPSIQIPTLLLHGTEDVTIPPDASEWLYDHLPDSRLEQISGEGHTFPLQNPDLTAEYIRTFIQP